MSQYQPQQGDIVFINCDPQAGHEQAGRRPAVIVSNLMYHHYVRGAAIACPITNTQKAFPLHVPLDNRTKTTGVVLCEQLKAFDLSARNAEFREVLPEDLLEDVLARIQVMTQ